MSNSSHINAKMLAVCNLVNEINSGGPVKTNSEIAKKVVGTLKEIVEGLKVLLDSNLPQKLEYHISKGGGMFPTIPWIAITNDKTKPSKGLSTAICFDKHGLGVVTGVLLPTGRDANFPTIYRGKMPELNVDGHSDFTKYNNQFINPKEFFIKEFSEKEFLNQLLKSISLLDKISLIKNKVNE